MSISFGTGKSRNGFLRREIDRLRPLLNWHIWNLGMSYVFCQRSDESVVGVLFIDMRDPTGDPVAGKDCWHQVLGHSSAFRTTAA